MDSRRTKIWAGRLYAVDVSSQPDLAPLEQIAYELAADWSVELGPPFTLSRYSYVAPACADAVLKVTPHGPTRRPTRSRSGTVWAPSGCGAATASDVRS